MKPAPLKGKWKLAYREADKKTFYLEDVAAAVALHRSREIYHETECANCGKVDVCGWIKSFWFCRDCLIKHDFPDVTEEQK